MSIFSISLTGTLLVWKKEYLWMSMPEARETLVTDTQATAQAIETITSNYTDNQVLSIQLFSENLALHKVYLNDGLRAWHSQKGTLLNQWRDNGRFEDWLVDLHHRFLLGNDIGLNIAGFSGILLILLVIIGVIIWWPRRLTLNKGLVPRRIKRVSKGELIVSHGNLGFVSLLPILLITITGVVLTYPNQSRDWLVEPFIDNDDYLLSEGQTDKNKGSAEVGWERVLHRSLQQYPQAQIRWVSPESYFTPYRIVGLQQTNGWNPSGQTSIYIDAKEGFMDININDLKRPVVERVFDFNYPLHTAKLGFWYRILITLLGLFLMTITMFGLIAFFKKK